MPAGQSTPAGDAVASVDGVVGAAGEVAFLTVAEVATLMRVSRMTVYRLVNSGTLPAVRVGRSVRVPAAAVHDYLRDAYVEAG